VGVVGDDDAEDVDAAVAGGGGGEALQLDALRLDEGTPLDEVLGRVAAHELLLHDREGDAAGLDLGGGGDGSVDVGAHGADGGAQGHDRDVHQAHGASMIPVR
jgi:hypothetical protein